MLEAINKGEYMKNIRMGKILALTFVILSFEITAFASNFGFIGAGARASGLGGAFIGVADDATAIFWNPGGLTHLLQEEVSFVGRTEFSSWSVPSVLKDYAPNSSDSTSLNFISFAYPTKIGRRSLVFALSVASVYDLDFNLKNQSSFSNFKIDDLVYGKIYQLSGGFAVDVISVKSFNLSFGSAFNWHFGERDSYSIESGISSGEIASNFTERASLKAGSNISMGIFTDLSYLVHMGAVVKFRLSDIERNGREQLSYNRIYYPDANKNPDIDRSTASLITLPQSYGIGFSLTPSDIFTIAADYNIIKWSEYRADGTELKYANGVSYFSDSHQIHLGMEFFILKSILGKYPMPVRLGFYTDPLPVQTSGGIKTSATFYTLGFGVGVDSGQLDFSMEYGSRDYGAGYIENIFRIIGSIIFKL